MTDSLSAMLEPLRVAPWLTRERARAYCLILALLSAALLLTGAALSRGGLDMTGKPLGPDFLSFWAASRLALAGMPDQAYSMAAHAAAERAVFGGAAVDYAAFFYPPVFLLVCLPLALLPYLMALGAWLLATGYFYWRVCGAYLQDDRLLPLAFAAFPAVLVNIGHGQNGFLSAALLGGALLALERRPWLAGFLFGCLAFKPHLALLVPIALAVRGEWRAFLAAALTGVALAAISLAVFGAATWRGFFAVSPVAREALEQPLVGFDKMQSAFAAVRLLGGSVASAYGVQVIVTVAAAGIVVWLGRARAERGTQGAALMVASLLATPFVLDYDLTLLAFPLAWLFSRGRQGGYLPWEKITLFAGFVLPLVSRLVAHNLGLPLAPFVLLALLAVVARRGWRESGRVLNPPARGAAPLRA